MEPVSERYGRKPILYASVSVLIFGSVLIIFLWIYIIFFSTCDGLGAAGYYFLARTILADIFKGIDPAKIMALIGAINGIAPASAPIVWGVIADSFPGKESSLVWLVLLLLYVRLQPEKSRCIRNKEVI